MREITGNAFALAKNYDILCILTNGTTKHNGSAVCGAGIAKNIQKWYPQFPQVLGNCLTKNGNHTQHILTSKLGIDIVAFPTKNEWFKNSDLELIKQSCKELVNYAQGKQVLLPRPGCGCGKLKWSEVKSVIETILPDNITVITYN